MKVKDVLMNYTGNAAVGKYTGDKPVIFNTSDVDTIDKIFSQFGDVDVFTMFAGVEWDVPYLSIKVL